MPLKNKQGDPFYWSPAWRSLRQRVLKRDGYRCTICDSSLVGPGQARIDHIKPRSTHPRLAMEIGNLRSLCKDCDAQAHREKGGVPGARNFKQRDEWYTGCDETGWPIDPNHHWNVERRKLSGTERNRGV